MELTRIVNTIVPSLGEIRGKRPHGAHDIAMAGRLAPMLDRSHDSPLVHGQPMTNCAEAQALFSESACILPTFGAHLSGESVDAGESG